MMAQKGLLLIFLATVMKYIRSINCLSIINGIFNQINRYQLFQFYRILDNTYAVISLVSKNNYAVLERNQCDFWESIEL